VTEEQVYLSMICLFVNSFVIFFDHLLFCSLFVFHRYFVRSSVVFGGYFTI